MSNGSLEELPIDQTQLVVDSKATPTTILPLCDHLRKLGTNTTATSLSIRITGSLEDPDRQYSPRFQRANPKHRLRSNSGKAHRQQLMKALLEALRNKPNLESLKLDIDPAVLVLLPEDVKALNSILTMMTLSTLSFDVAIDAEAEVPAFHFNANWLESASFRSPPPVNEGNPYRSSTSFLASIPLTSCPGNLDLTATGIYLDEFHPDFNQLIKIVTDSALSELKLKGIIFSAYALNQLFASLPETLSTMDIFSPGQLFTSESAMPLVSLLSRLIEPLAELDLSQLTFAEPWTQQPDPAAFQAIAAGLVDARSPLGNLTIPASVFDDAKSHSALLTLLSEKSPECLTIRGHKIADHEFNRFCHFLTEPSCILKSLTIEVPLSEQQKERLFEALTQSQLPCRLLGSDGTLVLAQVDPQASPKNGPGL